MPKSNNKKVKEEVVEIIEDNLIKENSKYEVEVNTHALNYRNGPGYGYTVQGVLYNTDRCIIVDENIDEQQNLWGKIQNTENWINLSFVKKVCTL